MKILGYPLRWLNILLQINYLKSSNHSRWCNINVKLKPCTHTQQGRIGVGGGVGVIAKLISNTVDSRLSGGGFSGLQINQEPFDLNKIKN